MDSRSSRLRRTGQERTPRDGTGWIGKLDFWDAHLRWHIEAFGWSSVFHLPLNCFIITFSFGVTHILCIIAQSFTGIDSVAQLPFVPLWSIVLCFEEAINLPLPTLLQIALFVYFLLLPNEFPSVQFCNRKKYAFKASVACCALDSQASLRRLCEVVSIGWKGTECECITVALL